MNVAFGMKAHSGWAALVAVGERDGEPVIVDRRRIELVEEAWAKQPYHAAARVNPAAARETVERGIEAAHRLAVRGVRAAVEREHRRRNEVAACAVLVVGPMPAWSVEEILAVHFRMHKAEGALFRDALLRAGEACGLQVLATPEKLLMEHAERALGTPAIDLVTRVATLGMPVGPPWGKDQKDAALAALVALQSVLLCFREEGGRHDSSD